MRTDTLLPDRTTSSSYRSTSASQWPSSNTTSSSWHGRTSIRSGGLKANTLRKRGWCPHRGWCSHRYRRPKSWLTSSTRDRCPTTLGVRGCCGVCTLLGGPVFTMSSSDCKQIIKERPTQRFVHPSDFLCLSVRVRTSQLLRK